MWIGNLNDAHALSNIKLLIGISLRPLYVAFHLTQWKIYEQIS